MKKYSRNLYCFSPPVMLFTFLFEFGAAAYLLWRYKMSTLVRLSSVMLLSLGTFQLSEYMICGGLGIGGVEWARLGYVSITLLPALGIHTMATLAGKKVPWLVYSAYATMAVFALYFVLLPGAINITQCRPNYAVFDMHHVSLVFFTLYYYGWLLTGAVMSWYWARRSTHASALLWLTGGYLVFMVPTATVNLIDPSTTAGIPSIMCGFAVLLAVVLLLFVLPKSGTPVKERSARPATSSDQTI